MPRFKDGEWEHKWPGLPVEVLVTWCEEFVVFLDPDLDVDYKTADSLDQLVGTPEVGKTLSEVRVLEAIPICHLDPQMRLAFRKMLGEAVARAFEEDHANAAVLLAEAREFVLARNQEIARRWLVSASGLATSAVVLLCVAAWAWQAGPHGLLGEEATPFIVSCGAGAVGALLSILRRAARLPLDPSAGRRLHYIEGVGHVAAGMIGGVMVWLAMKAGLVAPKLLDAGLAAQALLCMVGGASERLVPTLIRRVDVAGLGDNGKTMSSTKRREN
jgi:hypothetical protein